MTVGGGGNDGEEGSGLAIPSSPARPLASGGDPSYLIKQTNTQVFPLRVHFFNSLYFPIPIPFFHLFFSSDCLCDIFIATIPNQPTYIVFFGEAFI